MLTVEDVWAGYGSGDILRGVSIEVRAGEIVGILGRNGVGKTTLMRTLTGLLKVRSGSIFFQGRDLRSLPPEKRAQLGIANVPQGRGIFPYLTVAENLRVGHFVNVNRTRLRYDLVYKHFPILKERQNQRGGTLSGGQQQMLALGRALVGDPLLLLLDEPSEGVQPNIVQEIGEVVVTLNREEGLTVLLVDQNLDLMQAVAQRAYVMEKGHIVRELSREELLQTDQVAQYLLV